MSHINTVTMTTIANVEPEAVQDSVVLNSGKEGRDVGTALHWLYHALDAIMKTAYTIRGKQLQSHAHYQTASP